MTVVSMNKRNYEVIPGFFTQEAPTAGHPVPPRFGLLDDSPQRWSNFRRKLRELNESAIPGESFKLIIFCRHGQSNHNVGKEKYSTLEWKSHWGRTNGDGEITWGPDSNLTATGITQALHIKNEWEKERAYGIPSLGKIYTSPLTRALQTCNIAFGSPKKGHSRPPVLVVENCREGNGVYTYDKRGSRTYISSHFPAFHIEEGFSEEDKLWLSDVRETKAQMMARAESVLNMIFDEEPAVTHVCLTIHGGLINAFLAVLGCQRISLPTGSVYPVVVKGYGLSNS